MAGETGVGIAIHRKFFFAGFPQNADRFFRFAVQRKVSFDAKALVAVLRYQTVLAGKITFGETEIMNSIQQVGFAHAIAAANAHQRLVETKLLMKVVLKLKQRYGANL